jgi:hypothetical protein
MALKLVQLVQELGEERLPEPAPAASSSASVPQAASHSEREPQIWTASQESTESPIESDTSTTLLEGPSSPRSSARHDRAKIHVNPCVCACSNHTGEPEVMSQAARTSDVRVYAFASCQHWVGLLDNGHDSVIPIEAIVRRVFFFSNHTSPVCSSLVFVFSLCVYQSPQEGDGDGERREG